VLVDLLPQFSHALLALLDLIEEGRGDLHQGGYNFIWEKWANLA
jgi:hypothetical protein